MIEWDDCSEYNSFIEINDIIDNCDIDTERNIIINIDDIITLDANDLDDRHLLQYTYCISAFILELFTVKISKYSKNTKIINDILLYLSYLLTFIKILRSRIGTNVHDRINVTNSIKFSSYTFCNNSYRCQCVYGNDIDNCQRHHYAVDLVYKDINYLYYYINNFKTSNIILSDIDYTIINKGINTINHVMNHMYKEYENAIKLYCITSIPKCKSYVTPIKKILTRDDDIYKF
jgi:hypothetical protein